MNSREEFEKGVTKIVNEIAPIQPDEKKALIESYLLVYDSRQAKIDALTEENRRLKESQENTVKMLKTVLEMLDKKTCL